MGGLCMIATLASLISVLFALIAAILWASSAFVNLPVIGSAYGAIANLEPFYPALITSTATATSTCSPTWATVPWRSPAFTRRWHNSSTGALPTRPFHLGWKPRATMH
jgi:hypothetical protein